MNGRSQASRGTDRLTAPDQINSMAKTYRNLFEQIANFENLHAAYLLARRGKRYSADALQFGSRLEENLLCLRNELRSGDFRTGEYRTFTVYEPKQRLVAALPFRDRVVHHALCRVIEPIWETRFIHDSYACRVGKGTHTGADRVTEFLRRARGIWDQVYVLKMDVRSYFPSIDHGVLLSLVSRRVACPRTMRLITGIIYSWSPGGRATGLPIGNLTSQLFANVYLHELDKFVKHTLQIRFYVRYMDDAVIIHGDKRQLHEIKDQIAGFLKDKLKLRLNSKTSVFPAAQGVNFLGYRIWWSHRLLRKRSVTQMRRKLRRFEREYTAGQIGLNEIDASVQSWLGHAGHANTYRLREKLFEGFVLTLDR